MWAAKHCSINADFIMLEQSVRFLLCCLENFGNIVLHCETFDRAVTEYFFELGIESSSLLLHNWLYFIMCSTLLEVQRKTEDERKEYAKECENMRRCATPR